MKLYFCGKYYKNKEKIPYKNNDKGKIIDIKKTDKQIIKYSNIFKLLLIIFLSIPFFIISKEIIKFKLLDFFSACILGYISIYIHELLHALCFKEEVYIFFDFIKGIAFTVGTEDMSKNKYIFTCLFPNIVLGIIPYSIFLLNNTAIFLGIYGAICITTGYQDFINIYNVIRYTPKKSIIYLNGLNAFWYLSN